MRTITIRRAQAADAGMLHEALAALSGLGSVFQLKWTNDVLLNGGKLSGILLEREGKAVILGIGVNLAAAPELDDRGGKHRRHLRAESRHWRTHDQRQYVPRS